MILEHEAGVPPLRKLASHPCFRSNRWCRASSLRFAARAPLGYRPAESWFGRSPGRRFTGSWPVSGLPMFRAAPPTLENHTCLLRYHRRMAQYERQQRERCWQPLPQVRPSQRRFGIMGRGLGEDAGHKLVALDSRLPVGAAVATQSRESKASMATPRSTPRRWLTPASRG